MNGSNGAGDAIAVGRVAGHRGAGGEVTVRVHRGGAAALVGIPRVGLARPGEADAAPREVESARGYRDRWVLKLAGVDNADAAEALRGLEVRVLRSELAGDDATAEHPAYWLGMVVVDARDERELGRVIDVLLTGGVDLLVVAATSGPDDRAASEPLLVPLAEEIVRDVDVRRRVVRIDPPEGLLELNRPGA